MKDEEVVVTSKAYRCKIHGCISEVGAAVRDVLNHLQNTYGLIDDCMLFELKVILNELVLNAVKHGNQEDENKLVNIVSGVNRSGEFILLVEDEGTGYDYRCVQDRNKLCEDFPELCNIREAGRGLMIVRSLCDKIYFNKKGNRIVIVKKLNKI